MLESGSGSKFMDFLKSAEIRDYLCVNVVMKTVGASDEKCSYGASDAGCLEKCSYQR